MTIENAAKELETKAADLETRLAQVEKREKELAAGLATGSYTPVGNSANSDEQKALRAFGCSHVKQLVEVNVGAEKFAHVPQELKGMVLQLKQSVDVARMIGQVFHGGEKDIVGTTESMDRAGRVKSILTSNYGREELAARLKAFGSTSAGNGDEWVPTLVSSQYIAEYELDFLLESKFKQINLPSAPYEMTIQSGVTKARKIAENTAATDTNPGTGKITFSPIKSVEYYIMPEELTEDSAPDIMAMARDEVVRAQIRAWEAALINGDDDGTHIDSDSQAAAATVAEKFTKGLRRQAIANTANGGTVDFAGAVAVEGLRKMRAYMKKFGVNPLELMFIAGPSVYSQLSVLEQVATVDKFGPMATVLKGALSAYQGIPIYISEYMREDLNATGVYDATTTTKGSLLLVNKTRWYVGTRRPIKVKIEADLPGQDRMLMASYQRKDFKGHAQSASEVSAVVGYNITL
jgi:hypothetical protein